MRADSFASRVIAAAAGPAGPGCTSTLRLELLDCWSPPAPALARSYCAAQS
jgi:hypothetical protein